jgi:hypothetical protein
MSISDRAFFPINEDNAYVPQAATIDVAVLFGG